MCGRPSVGVDQVLFTVRRLEIRRQADIEAFKRKSLSQIHGHYDFIHKDA